MRQLRSLLVCTAVLSILLLYVGAPVQAEQIGSATLTANIETWAKLAAIAGVLFGVFKYLFDQWRKFKWEKARFGKEVVDEFYDSEFASSFMTMMDWSNRIFDINGKEERITRDDVVDALSTKESYNQKEVYIRDCADDFLDYCQKLGHYIEIGLITFRDVEYPIKYYIQELTGLRKEIDKYIEGYEFDRATLFLDRFEFWKSRRDRSRKSCRQE